MTGEFWSWDRYDSEARRLYDEGNYDAARNLLREGLSLYPTSAELRVSMGYAELAREEYAWARRCFGEALALEPDHEEALIGLGEVLLKLGERSRAFVCFDKVVRLGFAEDPDLMLSAGRALYREGLFGRARDFFRRALEADPECADAAAELAYALYRTDDMEGAVAWIRRALELDPGLHEARAFHGNLLYDRADFSGALAELEKIPATELWDPVAAWRLVELLRRVAELPADDARIAAYTVRLEELSPDPSPEEQLLGEVEAVVQERSPSPRPDRNQLDLFGWLPWSDRERRLHRIRLPDGRLYEGDWLAILRAMRDDAGDPSLSVVEFLREEARRLYQRTGVWVPADDPRSFLEEAAKAGILHIEA